MRTGFAAGGGRRDRVALWRAPLGEFRGRFVRLGLLMAAVFLALLARLFQLQVLEADDYKAIARENIVRKATLATTRGIVRDRQGRVLAGNRPSFDVYVVPARLDLEAVLPRLLDLLSAGSAERARLERRITKLRAADDGRKHQQILLAEDVSRDVLANLETHRGELPGVEVVSVPVRYYPNGEIGAHVLGYLAELDGTELARLRAAGYGEGDRLGAGGVERAWEGYLRGARGWEKVLVDARGQRRRPELGVATPGRAEPTPGRDLRLTIDADLQKAAHRAFRGELAGAVVLIEVRTGRVLAMYSKPSFDPNALSGGSGKEVIRDAFRRLVSDPLRPGLDKSVAGAYPPGSTFKPFTALAALERGLVDPRSSIQCRGALTFGGRTFRCSHVHGLVDLHKALAESCNVYFFTLAAERGVSMDMIADTALRFGFGSRTGIGLNADTSGRVPTKSWMTLHNGGHYQLGFTLNAAIGQGATTVTVLQLALAYAALGNGGTLYQPQLVRAVENPDGTVVQEFPPQLRRQIEVEPRHLRLVDAALKAGVNEEGGTAFRTGELARTAGIEMAGKTGTAQVSKTVLRGAQAERGWYFQRDHAWFAAYAPARSPEVAVVAFVEHGGFGGKHAAPIAFELVRAYLEQQRRPRPNEPGR